MSFKDNSPDPLQNLVLGDGRLGRNMSGEAVRLAFQQVAAELRELYDYAEGLLDLAQGPAGLPGLGFLSPSEFGAQGDGVGDDRAALVAADANPNLPLGQGMVLTEHHRVGSDLVINRPLIAGGGRLVVPNGVTVTVAGPVVAPPMQMFECLGSGRVALSPAHNAFGYPEWWGAAPGRDATAAIRAALAALPTVKLLRRDYVVSSTVLVPPYTRLEGTGPIYEGTTATRLLGVGPNMDVVQLGSMTYPGSLNALEAGAEVANLFVGRNAAPDAGSNCTGVTVGFSRFARVENVWSDVSIRSFRMFGSVAAILRDCRAKRSVAARGAGDRWIGFHVDGTSRLEAAGSNASLHLIGCSAELNVPIAASTGYRIDGRFTDVWLRDPETAGAMSVGIDVQGDEAGRSGVAANTNLWLDHPIIDQTRAVGIRVENVNRWGSVKISEPYTGAASGNAILLRNCHGHVGVLGGQVRANVSSASAVIVEDCRAPTLTDLHVAECRGVALVLTNVTGGKFDLIVQNVSARADAAVQLVSGCTGNIVTLAATGEPGRIGRGVQSLSASNGRNAFDLTRMLPGAVSTTVERRANAEAGSRFVGDVPA
ncbi:hypothetical protein ACFQPG_10945 [Sphingomonas sp. GCM10030256]|uniref:hypothetical protein n=1 Tax=Sphingomonas sp. GCM10030256 TaxID=3273427 RepID=UPI0036167A19